MLCMSSIHFVLAQQRGSVHFLVSSQAHHEGSLCDPSGRVSECGEVLSAEGHLQCQASSGGVPFHHPQPSCRHNQVQRSRAGGRYVAQSLKGQYKVVFSRLVDNTPFFEFMVGYFTLYNLFPCFDRLVCFVGKYFRNV